jgi:hypothetical protein
VLQQIHVQLSIEVVDCEIQNEAVKKNIFKVSNDLEAGT